VAVAAPSAQVPKTESGVARGGAPEGYRLDTVEDIGK
jgi:hypothetical protein